MKKQYRKIYNYNRMTQELWDDFSAFITTHLRATAHHQNEISNVDQLNKSFNNFNNIVKQAADKFIPHTFSSPRIFHAHSFKASSLHRALKHINHILLTLTRPTPLHPTYLTQHINQLLEKIKALTQSTNHNFSPQDFETHLFPTTKSQLVQLRTTLFKARNIENNNQKRETIQNFIDQRYTNFQENTTKMIDSILHRNRTPVTFYNIITPTSLLTHPQEIKNATVRHFHNWTKSNPLDQTLWNDWEQYYKPIPQATQASYLPLLAYIEPHEIKNTIAAAPNNKATGPTTVSNEMLKKLPFTAITTLTKIFNACLTLQTVPSTWHRSLIWPIAKSGYHPGDLSKTRPITLIEHIRKIFTKILTTRLNSILLRNDLLDPANNVALPLISTI